MFKSDDRIINLDRGGTNNRRGVNDLHDDLIEIDFRSNLRGCHIEICHQTDIGHACHAVVCLHLSSFD